MPSPALRKRPPRHGHPHRWLAALVAAAACAAGPHAASAGARGAEYHVGPGQRLANLGDVPWYKLEPGDTVYVHHRPEPYREKILISSRGTAERWIRVLGVPGPNGELPVISGDGATTSKNMHHRWQDPTGGSAIQWNGVVQIAVRAGNVAPIPGYIEVANLRIQDATKDMQFTAENGVSAKYAAFAACLYARSAQHLVVRDCVLANCGLGFFNWTGDGSSNAFWTALQQDTVLRNNTFLGNGVARDWSVHQVYTESDGVVIEGNRFGPMRDGAFGSQIKDRSAGTVIRYNTIEAAPSGWALDLVEPEASWRTLSSRPSLAHTFVYGNLIVSRSGRGPNLVHWNEDHYQNKGRANVPGGRLHFYDNTVAVFADRAQAQAVVLFNVHQGAFDCPRGPLPGVIDFRNNLVSVVPRTPGERAPVVRLGYCGVENFALGRNLLPEGWTVGGKSVHPDRTVTGAENVIAAADPGFVDAARDDFRPGPRSPAAGTGGALAPEVAKNPLGLDLTPVSQPAGARGLAPRKAAGAGSDLGALER